MIEQKNFVEKGKPLRPYPTTPHDSGVYIPKRILKIDVQTTVDVIPVNEVTFSEIVWNYSDKFNHKTKGVLAYYNLIGLQKRLNSLKDPNEKCAILKGIYEGGIKGEFSKKGSVFLPIDIDVKKEENKSLNFDQVLNERVFDFIKTLCVLSFRSKSQKGMAGYIHVPMLVNEFNTINHKRIAEAIYRKIERLIFDKFNVNVKLDDAQGAFRQIRYLAPQTENRSINYDATTFAYTLEETIVKNEKGVTQYTEPVIGLSGTQKHQYNIKNDIRFVIQQIPAFALVGANRVKYYPQKSTSDAGFISDNVFVNFSQTVFEDMQTRKRNLTAYDLALHFLFNKNESKFKDYLKKQGVKDEAPGADIFEKARQKFNTFYDGAEDKQSFIFDICKDLTTAPVNEKNKFISTLDLTPFDKNCFLSYLKFDNLLIFDAELKAEKYVSEVIPDLVHIIDANKKTIIKSETGTGKTTAIIKDFRKLKPNSRCLLLAPLTIIVDQLKTQYKDVVCLTGKSTFQEHRNARNAGFVVATYEQGLKHLQDANFDYIFIDEAHQLLLANDYKEDVITRLNDSIFLNTKANVIGLTGTPNNLFKNLGYHIVNVKTKTECTNVLVRYLNTKPEGIVLNHIQTFGVNKRYIFRLNQINTLYDLKNTLVKNHKYSPDQVLILHSNKEVKNSVHFKKLYQSSKFSEKIKIVLTTSIIDEGLSIKDYFDHSIFINTDFAPKAETIKQFFARFRAYDGTQIQIGDFQKGENYLYLKEKTTEYPFDFSLASEYVLKYKLLTENTFEKTTNNDFTDARLFYFSNGEVNAYYLANNVLKSFYASLKKDSFIDYLEQNFYIKTELDTRFECGSVEYVSGSKDRKNFLLNIFSDVYLLAEMVKFVSKKTMDKQIKEATFNVDYPGDPGAEVSAFCLQNLKTIEKYLKIVLSYKNLKNDTEPLTVKKWNELIAEHLLFNGGIKSTKTIKNELFSLRTLNTYKHPQTQSDFDSINKMTKVINEIHGLKNINVTGFIRILKKHKIVNFDRYTKTTLIALIFTFGLPFVYSEKMKCFIKIEKK